MQNSPEQLKQMGTRLEEKQKRKKNKRKFSIQSVHRTSGLQKASDAKQIKMKMLLMLGRDGAPTSDGVLANIFSLATTVNISA